MRYDGLNAKVKAMSGKLLRYGDYAHWSRLASVAEVSAALREHPVYRRAMALLEDSDPGRHALEQKIILSLAEDFARLYNFIGDLKLRHFLDFYFLKFEMNAISASPTAQEFLDKLRGTRLSGALTDTQPDDATLFGLETRLHLYFYLRVWRLKNKYLSGVNKKLAEHLIGVEIDLRNILWLYRMKTFYKLPATLMYANLIPIHYRLKLSAIHTMADARTPEDLLDEVARSAYAKVFCGGMGVRPEKTVTDALCRQYRLTRRMYPESLAPALAYLFFKELEIKNITSLVEAVRYGLPSAESLPYLTLPPTEVEPLD